MVSLEERFWAKVRKGGPDECWPWTGTRNPAGYGSFGSRSAHRFAYELSTGVAPGELQVGHRCHQKGCQNPRHLFVGTRSQIQANRAGAQANSTSGVRGVYWWAARRRWLAAVKLHGRMHSAGVYRTLEEADVAARAKRAEQFGQAA